NIRERLHNLGVPIRVISFDFKLQHILLTIAVIVLTTLIGCYSSAIVFVFTNNQPLLEFLPKYSPMFLSWVFVTVMMYLLPLVLAAGVVMYLLDRRSADDILDSADYSAAALLTFVGAAGLTLLVLLSYRIVLAAAVSPVTDATGQIVPAIQIMRILPWV